MDEWNRSVKAEGIFLRGTKETRVMVGNGDIHHFPLLYLFWLFQWLSSCGSILVLKDWCQKHTTESTDLGTNILKKMKGISFEHLGPVHLWSFMHSCQSDNSSACPGEAVSGAVLNQVGVRLGKRGNNMLIWIDRFVMLNNMDMYRLYRFTKHHVFMLEFYHLRWSKNFGLNIWSWSTVHWVVLL